MNFVAFDVETANANRSSICQMGLVRFKEGLVTEKHSMLIDPEEWFDGINISIHGITEEAIKGKPNFEQCSKEIFSFIGDATVVHHTSFDRTALIRASSKYEIEVPEFKWIDSARVARRTWQEVQHRGYGLKNLADRLGIEFQHHDATEDAEACGKVFVEAMRTSGKDLDSWSDRLSRRERSGISGGREIAQDGNPDGPHFGEVIVFTGTASRGARADIAPHAAALGYEVQEKVLMKVAKEKPVTVVLCEQDPVKLRGKKKSKSHANAEKWKKKGLEIEIVVEDDFWAMAEAY
jgi:DNA polymerase-3 subunit epsilon